MNVEDIILISEFLGNSITDDQVQRLLEASRQLSIADREYLYESIDGGQIFTEISMNRAEMGGYHRY